MTVRMQRRAFLESLGSVVTVPSVVLASHFSGADKPGIGSPRIIVLDVNETMLDISALGPHFARIFGSAAIVQEWFSTVLLYSEVTTIAGPYADFGRIARASLQMMAARAVALSPDDEAGILKGLVSLPA